jgi:hypothetical protein
VNIRYQAKPLPSHQAGKTYENKGDFREFQV